MLVEQQLPDGSKAIIEVAFDRGTIEAGTPGTGRKAGKSGKKAPVEQIAEVELELKAGSPDCSRYAHANWLRYADCRHRWRYGRFHATRQQSYTDINAYSP
jgi:hypothetical protein